MPSRSTARPAPRFGFRPGETIFLIAISLGAAAALVGVGGLLSLDEAYLLQRDSGLALGLLAVVAVVALAAALPWMLPNGQGLLMVTVVACTALSPQLEAIALPTGAFKVYIHDILIALLAANVVWRILTSPAGNRLGWRGTPLTLPLLAFFAMGVLQTFRALAMGIDFNDAMGDFRRGYFYLLVFFFPFTLPRRARTVANLRRAFCTGALMLIGIGLGQVLLGQLHRRMVLDAAHILDHYGLVVVAFLAYYCASRFLELRTARPSEGAATYTPGHGWHVAGAIVATMVVLLGNFRSVWLAFLAGAFAFFLFLPLRLKARAMALAAIGLVGLILLLGFMWTVPVGDNNRTVGDEIVRKLERTQDYSRDINIVWRQQSYAAAIEAWKQHPLLGTGLGSKNSFYTLQSDASIGWASRHRTHNGFLWVLQTTGLVGFALFLWLHGTFVAHVVAGLRQLKRTGRPMPALTLALFCFYIAFMTASAFDVLLEQSTNIIVIVVAMAACYLSLAEARELREPTETANAL